MVVLEIKGKQYAVTKAGEEVTVDHIDLEDGSVFPEVKTLLYKGDDGEVLVGKPYVESVVVEAKLKSSHRDKKIRVVQYQPKSGILKKNGHRSKKSVLTIEKIEKR